MSDVEPHVTRDPDEIHTELRHQQARFERIGLCVAGMVVAAAILMGMLLLSQSHDHDVQTSGTRRLLECVFTLQLVPKNQLEGMKPLDALRRFCPEVADSVRVVTFDEQTQALSPSTTEHIPLTVASTTSTRPPVAVATTTTINSTSTDVVMPDEVPVEPPPFEGTTTTTEPDVVVTSPPTGTTTTTTHATITTTTTTTTTVPETTTTSTTVATTTTTACDKDHPNQSDRCLDPPKKKGNQ